MKIQGKAGVQELSNGSEADVRQNRTGDVVVSQGHASYQEAVLAGNVYIGANLGGTPVTTQAGLSATTPALTLYNPVGSGVNLVLITATVNITASPAAAASFMLAYNVKGAAAPTVTTAATVVNAVLDNGNTPRGGCYRICTLAAAPVAFRFIGGTTGANAISGTKMVDNINGEVIIPPGVAVSVQASSAAACVCSFTWEEVKL